MNTNAMLPPTSREPEAPRGQRTWLWLAVLASAVLFGAASALQAADATRVSVDSAGDRPTRPSAS